MSKGGGMFVEIVCRTEYGQNIVEQMAANRHIAAETITTHSKRFRAERVIDPSIPP